MPDIDGFVLAIAGTSGRTASRPAAHRALHSLLATWRSPGRDDALVSESGMPCMRHASRDHVVRLTAALRRRVACRRVPAQSPTSERPGLVLRTIYLKPSSARDT